MATRRATGRSQKAAAEKIAKQTRLEKKEALAEKRAEQAALEAASSEAKPDGYVYLLRMGKDYKIGKSYSVDRRMREIELLLPEKHERVHTIRTDDPTGIEQYWHRRFKGKWKHGEWFALSSEDVAAFCRRKDFM